MNKFYSALIISLTAGAVNLNAQEVEYYESARGLSGARLKSELSDIVSKAGTISYGGLWDAYKVTDVREDGKVIDMYSSITNYVFGNDQCGNYKVEGDCYNREHSVPQSWFSKASPMVSDLWHVVPSDGKVNGYRSNWPFGEVGDSYTGSAEDFSKWGTSVTPGISGTVFEPNDEYKGDFARMYFFMATRYEDKVGSWTGGVFSGSYPHLKEGSLNLFLKWHEQDPVSEKEIARNEAIHKMTAQKNRNPYIDYPYLVDYIFGDKTDEVFDPSDTSISTEKSSPITVFVDGANIHIGNATKGSQVSITDLTGRTVATTVYVEQGQIITIDAKGTFIVSIVAQGQYFAKKIVM